MSTMEDWIEKSMFNEYPSPIFKSILRDVAMKHWHTSSALTGGVKDFFGHASGGPRTFLDMLQGGHTLFFTDT